MLIFVNNYTIFCYTNPLFSFFKLFYSFPFFFLLHHIFILTCLCLCVQKHYLFTGVTLNPNSLALQLITSVTIISAAVFVRSRGLHFLNDSGENNCSESLELLLSARQALCRVLYMHYISGEPCGVQG